MASEEALSAVDRAWLQMDRPDHPMQIVVLLVLRTALPRPALRRVLEKDLLRFRRFRCIPVNDPLGARWVEAPQFELDDHLLSVALPAGAGQGELEALVGELASTPLNPSRPLWSFHLVANVGAGCALIFRIHHCYADGVALLRVLLALAGQHPRVRGARRSRQAASSDSGLSEWPAAGAIGDALQRGAELLGRGVRYALEPALAGEPARLGANLAAELARLGIMADDPPTRLKRPLSGVRRVAWAQPLALEEVKVIGRVLGCTVNDVLVSVLAGALGRYLEGEGERTEGLRLRAVVPVDLRRGVATAPLGNRFGLVFVELPVGIRHPLERLYAVRFAMQQLKSSRQAMITLGLLTLAGSLPGGVEEQLLALLSAKASLVASNLPGPARALRLAGAEVAEVLFWVPQAGGIGTGVSMLSYCGRVQLGVMADRALVAEPRLLVDAMVTEFERLVFLVLLGAGSLGA